MYAAKLAAATMAEVIATGSGTKKSALTMLPLAKYPNVNKATRNSDTKNDISQMRRYQKAEMVNVDSSEFIPHPPFLLLVFIIAKSVEVY
ncbi:MAG: hypothetical protein AAB395_02210 [Patescibacteria group bacterium]